MLRATMGGSGVDSQLAQNAANALAAGVNIGYYHLFRPDSDGIPQAKHFLDTLKAFPPAVWLLAVDVERVVEPQRELSKDQYADQLAAFVEHIRNEIDILPTIYTSQGEWSALVGAQHDALFAQCDLWVANYTSALKPVLPRCWTTWVLWQYTSSGSVDGIVGRVDLNRTNTGTGVPTPTQEFIVPADFPHVIPSGGAFNAPRTYSFAPLRKQLHEGLDFAPTSAAVKPLRVVAPKDGTVVKVGFDARGYGNYLIIDHGNGERSWLAHLEVPAFVTSGKVQQGDLIGHAGNTGGTSTGTHLHWTLQQIPSGLDNYVVADVVDPEPLI